MRAKSVVSFRGRKWERLLVGGSDRNVGPLRKGARVITWYVHNLYISRVLRFSSYIP